jgi:hypothetical protein
LLAVALGFLAYRVLAVRREKAGWSLDVFTGEP